MSVIVPTLNEACYLPVLLEALHSQTRPPDEVIVADAGSTDGTVQLAQQAGARVVAGGRPAAGRNAGARAANGSLLLFLDADVLPTPEFLAGLLREFHAEQLDLATSLVTPLSDRLTDRLLCETTNLFLHMVQDVSPHAPGFCILVRREIHEAIGGFDETAAMAEDHDYVQRASRHGRFGVVSGVHIPVSVRRLEKEGVVRLAVKYFYCELHALAGRPVRSTPFVYEFGNYTRAAPRRRLVDVSWLRQQLEPIENPLGLLSKRSLDTLEGMGSPRLNPEAFRQRAQALLPEEVRVLRRYVRFRLAALRRAGRPTLQALVTRLREAELPETIALLDQGWWQPRGDEPDQGRPD